jgi:NAD(P)H-quinone oxidoreductase subunit 5
VFALALILILGLTHLISQAIDEGPGVAVIGRVIVLAACVATAYFGLQWLAARLTADVLPSTLALRGPFDLAIIAIVVCGFAAIIVVQGLLPERIETPRWQRWHAHVVNGFYVNTLANRFVLRFWPTAPARSFVATSTGKQA